MQSRKHVAADAPNEFLQLNLLVGLLNSKKNLDNAVADKFLYIDFVTCRSKFIHDGLVRVAANQLMDGAGW